MKVLTHQATERLGLGFGWYLERNCAIMVNVIPNTVLSKATQLCSMAHLCMLDFPVTNEGLVIQEVNSWPGRYA